MKQWIVGATKKVVKQAKLLPEEVCVALQLLFVELQNKGPNPGAHWPHYGKLRGIKKNVDIRHCHISRGKPTYVCCWEVYQLKRMIKVYYVGTHEKAPY